MLENRKIPVAITTYFFLQKRQLTTLVQIQMNVALNCCAEKGCANVQTIYFGMETVVYLVCAI